MDPFKQIAEIITGQARKAAGQAISGIPCELGTITASGLKLDTFKYEIPDFLVAEWQVKLHIPAYSMTGDQTGLVDSRGGSVTGVAIFGFQATEIDGVRMELKPDLQPGDRVLAIPVNGGQDAVVISKVVPYA